MATSRSIQLMLHAVYIRTCALYLPPPLTASLPPSLPMDSTWTSLNCIPWKRLFPRHRAVFQHANNLTHECKREESSQRKPLQTQRENVSQNRVTVCFPDLTGLRAPCFKARQESVKWFPWVTALFGAATMKITYVVRQSQKAPTGLQPSSGSIYNTFSGSWSG